MAKKSGKKDFAQNALRVVEQATTSQLIEKKLAAPIKMHAVALLLLFVAVFSCVGCSKRGNLRGSFEASPDGKTYLAVIDGNRECRAIMVDGKAWPNPSGKAGSINPGHHTISCGGEIGFDIPSGVVFKFDYWGP